MITPTTSARAVGHAEAMLRHATVMRASGAPVALRRLG